MDFDIPLAHPDLSDREQRNVLDALRSGWISSRGPYVARFEREFAELCATRCSISVCNGTVALHLALLTMKVGPGDEVVVPSLTYVATANAVRYVGAEPVFADVDPETWCLNPGQIERAITPRTKGIIAVHLYGHPADMDEINRVANANGLWVIEDAAEAPLATYKGRPTGGLAPIATFSFYGNKILTSGEGGAITLSNPDLEHLARMLRDQGMDPQRRYFFPITGYNFRLTNVACAILCAQIERQEHLLARRYAIFSLYRELLSDVPGIGFQPVAPWATLSPWLFCITVNEKELGCGRDHLMHQLAQKRIDTRPFFIPLHSLPPFSELSRSRRERLPTTDKLSRTGINLPTYSGLSDDQVERVCKCIRDVHVAVTYRRK